VNPKENARPCGAVTLTPATSLWTATSPCTPRCVIPVTARVPAVRTVRRTAAVTRTVIGALAQGGRIAEPATLLSRAGAVLDALGVRLDARGGPLNVPGVPGAHRGTLVVANHISWLDIIALLAIEPVTMLAKREVTGWPLIGPLVQRAGTLFIDRDSLRTLPATVNEISAALRAGHSVAVFPQGATWCSGAGGAFRRATFQAAIDASAPVRPVTIRYDQKNHPTTVPAFLGDDDFTTSLRRVIGAADLTARVTVHPPLLPAPGLDDRRTLAAHAHAVVSGVSRTVRTGSPGVGTATLREGSDEPSRSRRLGRLARTPPH
jgi:1-acyl-sn-glycerol-3-phosphate acyltransferase